MSPAQLAAEIRGHRELLLMSDYDGTLVPLAPRPELALPGEGLLNLLRQLLRRPGLHLAIISGRPVTDLRRLLPVPGLFWAGLHGSQVAGPDGVVVNLIPEPSGDIPWPKIFHLARKTAAGTPGFLVENKGEGVALHYRLAEPAAAAAALRQFRCDLQPFLPCGLELLPGHKILEIRRRGINKGLAVTYFTRLWPQALPLYLGDDRTDEDAFAALPAGGLAVGVGSRFRGRTRFYLDSVAAVNQFLELLIKDDRELTPT